MEPGNYSRVWGILCWVGALAVSLATGLVAGFGRSVPIEYQISPPGISLHEPAFIVFSVRNELAERVDLDLGFNRTQNFALAIIEPSGALVTPPRPGPHEGINRSGRVELAPGETYRQTILINEFYQFETPGTYRISVRMVGSISDRSGALRESPPSQELSLTVAPADHEKLRRVCQQLVDSATSSNAAEALDAARALGYIEDLTAVPYLERLTKQGAFLVVIRPRAIDGLARIANREGIEQVVSRLELPSPELESSIRAAQSALRRPPGR
jgi:hypothetical protein